MLEIYTAYGLRNPILCIAVFITIVPIIFLIRKRAYSDPSFRLLFFYLSFKLMIDLLMFRSACLQENNLILYNLSIPVFYIMLSGMFYYKLNSEKYKTVLIACMVGFSAFTLWDVMNSNPEISDFHNHRAVLFAKTVEGVLIIAIILLYFYEIIKSLQIPNLLSFPFFWICSGLLLYYSSFIFIAPVLHYVATWNNPIDLGITQIIPTIFEIICALFFSIGINHYSANRHAKQ
jgi:hypothetical protein